MSESEAITPFFMSARTTSAPVFFILEASSPTPMASGIWTLSWAFLAISNCSFCMRSRSSARRLALAAACCWRCFCLFWNFSLPRLTFSPACAPARRSKRSSYLPRFTLPPPRVSMTRFSGTWRGTWGFCSFAGAGWGCWACGWGCWAGFACCWRSCWGAACCA